ncbi:MAG: gliding motility-associated C-terminal domain-containing protein [Cyclobacteriaceae bacterium]|nr:gliding motility-associated C-terminal domain-containing protein [Cyclobacteriaceae bacterium]
MRVVGMILFCTISVTSAQTLTVKGALLSISQGTVFSVKGDAYNEGTLVNDGDFQISGLWQNDGQYEAGEGEFTLSSAGDQIINHNAQSFNKLTITGGGNKLFLADLTILETLTLTDGRMVSQNDAMIHLAQGVGIAGGSAQSHIVGRVSRNDFGSILFPLGNGVDYLPITIETEQAGAITVSLVEPNPISETDFTLAGIDDARTWQIDFEGDDAHEVALHLPSNSSTNFTDPVVAFTSGEFYTAVSPLSINGSLAISDPFSSSSGLFTIGQAGTMTELPNIKVFNLVTPNGDGIHDFLKIENIEAYPANTVSIFNRWGDMLMEVDGYDNANKKFEGSKSGTLIPDGTYFYVVKDGRGKKISGFFELRR